MIRFAIEGFGHIGKKHTQTILANTEGELLAVLDVDSNLKNHTDFPASASFFEMLTTTKKIKA